MAPVNLGSLVVKHPELPRKETCTACLQDLQTTLQAIQGVGGQEMKARQRKEAVDSLTRRIKKLYWTTGKKNPERAAHFARCRHQTADVRNRARSERDKMNGEGPVDSASTASSYAGSSKSTPDVDSGPSAAGTRRTSRRTAAAAGPSYDEDALDEELEEQLKQSTAQDAVDRKTARPAAVKTVAHNESSRRSSRRATAAAVPKYDEDALDEELEEQICREHEDSIMKHRAVQPPTVKSAPVETGWESSSDESADFADYFAPSASTNKATAWD